MKGLIYFISNSYFLFLWGVGGEGENLTRTAGGRCAFFFFFNKKNYVYSLIMLLLHFFLLTIFWGQFVCSFLVFPFKYIFDELLE